MKPPSLDAETGVANRVVAGSPEQATAERLHDRARPPHGKKPYANLTGISDETDTATDSPWQRSTPHQTDKQHATRSTTRSPAVDRKLRAKASCGWE